MITILTRYKRKYFNSYQLMRNQKLSTNTVAFQQNRGNILSTNAKIHPKNKGIKTSHREDAIARGNMYRSGDSTRVNK